NSWNKTVDRVSYTKNRNDRDNDKNSASKRLIVFPGILFCSSFLLNWCYWSCGEGLTDSSIFHFFSSCWGSFCLRFTLECTLCKRVDACWTVGLGRFYWLRSFW